MKQESNTIVLIHGLWMTPRSWDPFREFYQAQGNQVFEPTWPYLFGKVEEIRRNPSVLKGLGITKIADHYEKFIRSLAKSHDVEETPLALKTTTQINFNFKQFHTRIASMICAAQSSIQAKI